MDYCKYALKLFRRKIVCGSDCPIINKCPVLIMGDATDEGVEKAMEAMLEVISAISKSN